MTENRNDSREAARIADQIRRSFSGDAWHGPALRALVGDVTAHDAAARPVAGAHTIWELVLHLEMWQTVVRRRLAGETVSPSALEDWPALGDKSDAGWRGALVALDRAHSRLRDAVAATSDDRLWEAVAGQDYTVYVMLHGAVQHAAYHGGQIAILKKALDARDHAR